MKRTILLVTLILAVVLAMSAFTGALGGNGENTASHQICGELEGTLSFVPFPNAATIFDVDALGHASGIVTGLGSTNMFTFHRPFPDENGNPLVTGLVKIVTASHDVLQGHYAGTTIMGPEPNHLTGIVDFEITGGTGRFANASGTIHATANVPNADFTVWEWSATWVLEGTVDY